METTPDHSLEEHPTGERWDPLGAPNDEDDDFDFDKMSFACDEQHQ